MFEIFGLPCHRLRIHRCATRGISCLTWMAWVRHTHAHFWQVHMQNFIRNYIGKCQINGDFKKTFRKVTLIRRNL